MGMRSRSQRYIERGMKRLVVLNFFPAFYPPRSGGEQRYYYLYRHLSKYYDVTLLSPTFPDARPEVIRFGETFREHRIPKEQVHKDLHAQLDREEIGRECSGLVCALASAEETAYKRACRQLIAAADVIIHDSPFTVEYDEGLGTDRRPRIYNSYNVEAVLARQMFEGPRRDAYIDTVQRLEARLVRCSELVFATSVQEKESFQEMYGCDPGSIVVIANGFEPADASAPRARPPGLDRPFALFLGSRHIPNLDAARFISGEVATRVNNLRFAVAGSVCETLSQAPRNVLLLGVINEAQRRWVLENCAVGLNPVESGAGTNLKMIDYMSAGIAVVSTPFGARGIGVEDGKHCLIRERRSFAEAVELLSVDSSLRAKLGTAARAFTNSRYSWSSIAETAHAAISAAVGPASRRKQPRLRLLVLNDFSVARPKGGGEIRIREIFSELARSFEVTLLCLSREPRVRETSLAPGFRECSVPKTPAHRRLEHEIDKLHHISAADVVATLYCVDNETLVSRFQALTRDADVVVCCHPYMAPLLRFRPVARPVIYDAANVESGLKERLLSEHPFGAELLRVVRETEAFLCRTADRIVCVSEQDAEEFGARGRRDAILVRNGVAVPRAEFRECTETRIEKTPVTAVFIGSGHYPNVEAVRFLIDNVAAAAPEVRFEIMGTVCDGFSRETLPRNVILCGFLDDAQKNQHLERAAIGLNPVVSGGGSNLKLAEFFAHGLAVVSTPFGVRGYQVEGGKHLLVVEPAQFADAVSTLAQDRDLRYRLGAEAREYALRSLSWKSLASGYRDTIVELARRSAADSRKRLLAVTYRYTEPALGGAELYLEKLLRELSATNVFAIDIATIAIDQIENRLHFSTSCRPEPPSKCTAPEFAQKLLKFPLTAPADRVVIDGARRLSGQWETETLVQAREFTGIYDRSLLMGGWFAPEEERGQAVRWSGRRAEVFCAPGATALNIVGTAPARTSLSIHMGGERLYTGVLYKRFSISVALKGASGGVITLSCQARHYSDDDPRMLGVRVFSITETGLYGRREVPLDDDFERCVRSRDVGSWVDSLIHLAENRPAELSDLFYQIRGPQSRGLEEYLRHHTRDYDVVLVQGVPFSVSIMATRIAKAAGVPVAMLPHFHLEDRYYHWRDYYEVFRTCDCVFAFPGAAKRLVFDRFHARSRCIPGGGVDYKEYEDLNACRRAFRALAGSGNFVLVLGRKSRAKRYTHAIDAVHRLRRNRYRINVVLIGQDEDREGIPRGVINLGQQPRNIVLGALAECLCLVSMSDSESFGMVILEAWMCGRPVVANRDCIASAELIDDGVDGFLCRTVEDVAHAIEELLNNPERASRMGSAGREKTIERYGWQRIAGMVEEELLNMIRNNSAGRKMRAGQA